MKKRTEKWKLASTVTCALMIVAIFPVSGEVHLENPVVEPSIGIAGKEIFRITVDYMNEISPWPIPNFESNMINDDTNWGDNDEHPRLAVDKDGDVHKVWMREINTDHWEIYYAELRGSGPTSKVNPKQISEFDSFNSVYPSIALDSADDAHVIWVDFRNAHAEIYYSKIDDETGDDLTSITGPSDDAAISSTASSHAGRAVGFPPVSGDVVDGVQAAYIEHPDIVVDPLDLVHIVWSDERDNPGVWEVYYQRQTNHERPDIPSNVLNNDLLMTGPADNVDSMCPVINIGLGAIHIAWQDKKDGCWEVYYQKRSFSNPNNPPTVLKRVSHVGPSDGFNSASPDIGVDSLYIHITWMDQRDQWYQDDYTLPQDCQGASCCLRVPHIWDPSNNQYQWEIYKVMLWENGDFFTWQGNPIKRQSDMTTCRGCGRYTGPGLDGYSMYPRIAVESIFRLTHIAWHDNRWGDWEIYYTEIQSYCENPEEDKRVTTYGGSDFWAVWPPTNDASAEIVVLTSAPSGAEVTISNPNISAQTGTAFPLSPYICVLDAFKDVLMSSCDGGVMGNALHITSTAPVTVLFRTHSGLGDMADDIYLVQPTTRLGSEYYALSYPYSVWCSWYVVIATEDNTQVTYESCDGSATATTLNQGETLTVPCGAGMSAKDVTGLHVSTDVSTPVGFIAGSKLSLIPPSYKMADTLMAMLLPVKSWGYDYYTVPLEPILPYGDIIRIQASQNNTEVHVNNVSQGFIGAGEYIELDTLDLLWIHSDKPVQVAQYAKGGDVAGVGDPFEMVIIPSEEFSRRYSFYSPKWSSQSQGSYVTIIAPDFITQAWLDGSQVTAWTPGPGVGKHATIQVREGEPHTVEADYPVGVYSYGYQEYGSYGCPVGFPAPDDMYPDIALDPLSLSPQRAHLKWQTDRHGFWRIYETRRKGKGDPGAEYIIAELYRDESPEDIFTFNLHRVYPYPDITFKPITYGFTFGLPLPGNYHSRICACDSSGYEYCTDWIDGPKVVPQKQLLTGIFSTFDLRYDIVNRHNVAELYIRVVKEDYSNKIYDIEIFPELQQPDWDSVEALEAPVGWSFEKSGNGVRFYTETNPLLTCQRVKFTFRVEAERISWYIRIHVTDHAHQNVGIITSTRRWLYYFHLM
ncbi:MAG: hypothetical protein AYK19_01690 [Theionarchaea archaeon DG-70-1]|nr:MAG: hypothetical protein AYK19_01690 [Theionarchaea archaeon DG-70-1]